MLCPFLNFPIENFYAKYSSSNNYVVKLDSILVMYLNVHFKIFSKMISVERIFFKNVSFLLLQ